MRIFQKGLIYDFNSKKHTSAIKQILKNNTGVLVGSFVTAPISPTEKQNIKNKKIIIAQLNIILFLLFTIYFCKSLISCKLKDLPICKQ